MRGRNRLNKEKAEANEMKKNGSSKKEENRQE